jgi:hypothetical protein
MVSSGSGETVLEVGTFNNHNEFTANRPNGRIGPAVIMRVSVSSVFNTRRNSTPLAPPH